MIELTQHDNAVLIPVKVVPGASRTRLMGEWKGRLKIAVAAAPEKGKANKELTAFLAKQLAVKKSQIDVISGPSSPMKTLRVLDASVDAVRAALNIE